MSCELFHKWKMLLRIYKTFGSIHELLALRGARVSQLTRLVRQIVWYI